MTGDHRRRYALDKVGRLFGHRASHEHATGGSVRNTDLEQFLQRLVDSSEVLLDNRLAAFAICLVDTVLDGRDRFVARQYARERKEARLHDGVDATTHTRFLRDAVAVDHEYPQVFLDNVALNGTWQVVPDLIWSKWTVEQECAVIFRRGEHVQPLEKAELVACDEVGGCHQVRRVDRIRAEAEVRDRD